MTSSERVAKESANPLDGRLAELRRMMPEVFTEGKVDFSKLHKALGDFITEEQERFNTVWVGKRSAIQTLQTPSRATRIPARDESVDFDATGNIFIEGDNLEVMKLLYKSYFGRVKLIYIDPPYNTGKEFIYPDDFGEGIETYLRLTGQVDAAGNWLTSNPETGGRYHSKWLSMMYPRLFLACQLLKEDGVIVVSIGDHEVHNLRTLLNEIFGEENFIAHVVWQKKYVSNMDTPHLLDMHDHLLVFGRQKELVKANRIGRSEETLKDYKNPDDDPRGPWRAQDLSTRGPYNPGLFTITGPNGDKFDPPPGRFWRCDPATYQHWVEDKRIWFGKSGEGRPMLKAFLSEATEGLPGTTWWDHEFAGHNKEATLEMKELFDGASPFDTSKPVRLLRRIIELFAGKDALILDFFAGSGTTAHAVLESNRADSGARRFILVQLPEPTAEDSVARRAGFETIADIAKERVRRVVRKLQNEEKGKLDVDSKRRQDRGFRVFKLAKSNYRPWRGDVGGGPETLVKQLELQVDPLIEGWKAENVVYEVLIKDGLSLTSKIERDSRVKSNAIFKVSDTEGRSLYICLDDAIKRETGRLLGLKKDDLFVCRDSALTDELAANLALQCRLKTI